MAWNEPPKNRDPWNRQRREEEELEESLRRFQERLRQLFGFKKRPPNSGGGSGGTFPSFQFTAPVIGIALAVLLVLWLLSGIFIVYSAESAVILRFGAYRTSVGPGPHWAPSLIDTVYKFNEQKISSYSYNSDMLTLDENVVSVAVAVQYRIIDAKKYRFSVVEPEKALEEATASALRQVIGNSRLDEVLTRGREKIRSQVHLQLKQLLTKYNTGLVVTDVALQPAKAPDRVKEAFDDAIKAQEDEQRYINEAQAEARKIIESVKGQAQRKLNEADAFRNQAVLNAKADVAGYLALLPQYQKAPEVTRTRLYWDTLENVLSHSIKMVTTDSKNNQMLYVPLDKMLEQAKANSANNADNSDAVDDTQANSGTPTTLSLNEAMRHNARPTREDASHPSRQARN
jgi:membrane protease subunit HflK